MDKGEKVDNLQPMGKIIFEIGVEEKGRRERGKEEGRKEGKEGKEEGRKEGKEEGRGSGRGRERKKKRKKDGKELYNIKQLPVALGEKYSESCGNHSITHEMF